LTEVTIAIIFAILVHLLRIGKKNKDMEEDFRRYYNEYLNPDINNIKSDGFKVANKPAYYLSETELKPLIIRAFEKYTTDDLRSAVAIYDKILDLNPCLIDQLTMRAQCLERLNFNLDAIDDYESAISNDSTDGNLYGLLGLLYQKVGNFESAEKYLKLSIEKGWKMYEPNFNMLSLLNNADLKNALMEKCKKPENLMRRNKKDFEDDLSEIDRNVFNTNLIKSIEGVKYGLALDPKNKVLLELHDYFYSKLN
jgi:tetratricopeptide (TPR) repeat protein